MAERINHLHIHIIYIGEGNGTPLQYSCLENPMDGGAWKAAVHGVARSWTWLNDFTFTFHFHALEKEMAAYSIVLARRIPGTGEPGGLPSMGSHRVGHDWSDLAAAGAVYSFGGWSCLQISFISRPSRFKVISWFSYHFVGQLGVSPALIREKHVNLPQAF